MVETLIWVRRRADFRCRLWYVPSAVNDEPAEVLCSICHQPIDLTNTATDENGQAVHETCYAQKLAQKKESHGNAEDEAK